MDAAFKVWAIVNNWSSIQVGGLVWPTATRADHISRTWLLWHNSVRDLCSLILDAKLLLTAQCANQGYTAIPTPTIFWSLGYGETADRQFSFRLTHVPDVFTTHLSMAKFAFGSQAINGFCACECRILLSTQLNVLVSIVSASAFNYLTWLLISLVDWTSDSWECIHPRTLSCTWKGSKHRVLFAVSAVRKVDHAAHLPWPSVSLWKIIYFHGAPSSIFLIVFAIELFMPPTVSECMI